MDCLILKEFYVCIRTCLFSEANTNLVFFFEISRYPSIFNIQCEWLGREDSNLRMQEPKSCALPLGDAPKSRMTHPAALFRCSGNFPESGRTFRRR